LALMPLLSIAMLRLVEGQKSVVEGGGAAGLAALLPGAALDVPELKGQKVIVPLCGGNIDTTILGRVIERGLSADGRMLRISSAVSDRPGGLAEFTSVLAELGASVKDIFHERAWLYTSVDQVLVKCVLETSGPEHNEAIVRGLREQWPETYRIDGEPGQASYRG